MQRTRFAADIVKAIRARVGADYPIIFRFSQWKQQDFTARLALTPDELARFLEPLTEAGTDIFHCSTRRFWEPEFEGSTLNLAGWTKKITGKPTITVGSVGLKGADFVQTFRTREEFEIGDLGELEARLEQRRVRSRRRRTCAAGRSALGGQGARGPLSPNLRPSRLHRWRHSRSMPTPTGSRSMRQIFKPLVAATVLASLALPFAPAEAQWVFVARKALGRIHQMTEGSQPDGRAGYDFATVLLDAHADKIFSTALELARKNPSVRILMQDPGRPPRPDRRGRPHRPP